MKVSFFFGAGAEAIGNFDLPTGNEFMKSTLFSKNEKSNLFDGLNNYFEGKTIKLGKHEYIYSRHCLDSKNTMKELLKNWLRIQNENNSDFNKKYEPHLSQYINSRTKDKMAVNIFRDNEDEILRQFSKKIKSDDYKVTNEVVRNIFDENSSVSSAVGSLLDKHFHTIVNPGKFGPNNFSRIFNYYWSCYFAVVEPITNRLELNYKYRDSNNNFDYFGYLSNINDFSKELYGPSVRESLKFLEPNSYYNIIKEYYVNREIDITGILTTNYYLFPEIVHEKVAYLNGRLDLFEVPEKLLVTEYETHLSNDVFFPFVFGQSYLKPIVDHNQIVQFNKAYEILGDSDVLVILGYNVNEDDNHINSYLTHFLSEKKENREKKIICVTKDDFSVDQKLRTDKAIIYCQVDYGCNRTVVEKIVQVINSL